MKLLLSALAICMATLAYGQARPLEKSELILGKDAVWHNGIYVVTVPKHPNPPNETRGVVLKLNPQQVAGRTICFRARMRWYDIGSDINGSHVGGKILGYYANLMGVGSWTASRSLVGTEKAWQEISYVCQFPRALKEVEITFGIQQGWGTLEFRDPIMEVMPVAPMLSMPENFTCDYSPAVRNLPMRRGVMSPVPGKITIQDIHDLGGWGADLLRYQIVDGLRDIRNLEEYGRWMDQALDKLDTLMPSLREHDIRVIIDMHWPPGGRYSQNGLLGTAGAEAADAYGNKARFLMMDEEAYRQAFLDTWKRIAARYKDNPMIYGYDLVNEPEQRGPAKYNYWQLQFDAAKAIREIDPETPIIVESNNWCSPLTYDEFYPMPLKNIIYQIHMYYPGPYTHQGVGDEKYIAKYPTHVVPLTMDKEQLRQVLRPAIDFQKKYHAKMFVGEFSVTAWTPDAVDYLRNVIELFEEYRWPWTYHAFREWEGWSVEHAGPPGKLIPVPDTDRKRLLLDYFKRNQGK